MRLLPSGSRATRCLHASHLITGFEQDPRAWGSPVDAQPLPDGSVLVSDDLAGAVYRVTYKAQTR